MKTWFIGGLVLAVMSQTVAADEEQPDDTYLKFFRKGSLVFGDGSDEPAMVILPTDKDSSPRIGINNLKPITELDVFGSVAANSLILREPALSTSSASAKAAVLSFHNPSSSLILRNGSASVALESDGRFQVSGAVSASDLFVASISNCGTMKVLVTDEKGRLMCNSTVLSEVADNAADAAKKIVSETLDGTTKALSELTSGAGQASSAIGGALAGAITGLVSASIISAGQPRLNKQEFTGEKGECMDGGIEISMSGGNWQSSSIQICNTDKAHFSPFEQRLLSLEARFERALIRTPSRSSFVQASLLDEASLTSKRIISIFDAALFGDDGMAFIGYDNSLRLLIGSELLLVDSTSEYMPENFKPKRISSSPNGSIYLIGNSPTLVCLNKYLKANSFKLGMVPSAVSVSPNGDIALLMGENVVILNEAGTIIREFPVPLQAYIEGSIKMRYSSKNELVFFRASDRLLRSVDTKGNMLFTLKVPDFDQDLSRPSGSFLQDFAVHESGFFLFVDSVQRFVFVIDSSGNLVGKWENNEMFKINHVDIRANRVLVSDGDATSVVLLNIDIQADGALDPEFLSIKRELQQLRHEINKISAIPK